MKQQPSSTRWPLAAAIGCALIGLLLRATAPDSDRPAGPQLARSTLTLPASGRAARATPIARPHRRDEKPAGAPTRVVARGDGIWFAAPRPHAEAEPVRVAYPPEPPRYGFPERWVAPPVGIRRRPPAPVTTREPVAAAPAPAPRKRAKQRRPVRTRRSTVRQREGGQPNAEPSRERQSAPDTALPPAVDRPETDGAPPETDGDTADDVAIKTDDDVAFPTDDRVAIPVQRDAPPEDGTVSLWVQPGWERGDDHDATLVQLGEQLRIEKSEDSLHLETAGSEDGADVGVPVSDWRPGDWHHVTATWSEDGIALYIDGQLVGRRFGRGLMHLPAYSELLVGSDRSEHGRVARGLIGRVNLRNRSLDDIEVARTYRDAIGDRSARDDEPGDRGERDRGRSEESARGGARGRDDGSSRKTSPAARDTSYRRRSNDR